MTQTKSAMELSIFHKTFQKLFGSRGKSGHRKTLEAYIEELVQKKQKIQFVQVGASDCGLNDPLQKYVLKNCAKGLIIEPIKQFISKAQDQYRSIPGLFFANCAIDYKKGIRAIYKIKSVAGLPDWAYQVCSFSREVLLKHRHKIPGVEDLIIEEMVLTESLDELMTKSGFRKPDLLLIDTEGYDSEILQMFPFDIHRPECVIFEHKHLNKSQLKVSLNLLQAHCYNCISLSTDTIGLRESKHKK